MNALNVSLSSIPAGGLPLDITVPEDSVRPEGAAELGAPYVRVEGHLDEIDTEYLFRGQVSGAYVRACDRCLETIEAPFCIDVTWLFEEGAAPHPLHEPEDEEEEPGAGETNETRVGYYQGGALDLSPLVWEEVALGAPYKCVCKEDCAGLCPKCGANLNEGSCACQPDAPDALAPNNGLAALADMFPELRRQSGEE